MNYEKIIIDGHYATLIQDLKATVQSARLKAHRAVNTELIRMYWQIGKTLLERQKLEAWGSKYLEQVSRDLTAAFPGMRGFSLRNLKYMRQFYQLFEGVIIGQQPAAQLPWTSITMLLDKKLTVPVMNWYAQHAVQ